MATIYVENAPYEVKDGQNLLHACLSLGFDIPYFCWHPAMHSVGACRQCAVKMFKDAADTRGQIVMACMTPVQNGARISIDDPDARKFRAGIIELLMANHPHDCPVCDEGGECHLQDMTVMSGHARRRYRFPKRTHRNQNLGPFLNHEMNRCIQCYRCVRFYLDYAAGRDLNVFGWHDRVYFGRHEDGVLASEFSGNLIEVCPTGVFTDKTFKRHFTRKWDLQTAPSVCVHCGLGCNTLPGERYGTLRRIRNRYHGQVNGYWLCDRGRFGYEFVNSERRVRHPSPPSPLAHVGSLLRPPNRVIGIGSPRASLESNFALRSLVGPEHFYLGLSAHDYSLTTAACRILSEGPARSPSMQDVAACDAVFLLGQDATQDAPLLALALRRAQLQQPMRAIKDLHISPWNDAAVREALQQDAGPLFLATCDATQFDGVATRIYRGAPDELARLASAVARRLTDAVPPVEGLPDDAELLAQEIAAALRQAQRPLIVVDSRGAVEATLRAAANVAWALAAQGHAGELCLTVPECNTLGLGLMGGKSLADAMRAVRDGTVDVAVVLENDLYRRAERTAVDALLGGVKHLVVLDHLATPTAERAEVLLPAATFAEARGTLVNSEGRAQRFFRVMPPDGEVQESWHWLASLASVGGASVPRGLEQWRTLDDVLAALAAELPVFRAVPGIAPPEQFRELGEKIPCQPHRYSGRTAMHAHRSVHEPKPPDDPDSPLAFSMEGYQGQPPPSLLTHDWAPGWNSVQAVNKLQTQVGGPLRGGDPGARLLEPKRDAPPAWFTSAPGPFERRSSSNQWLVVPVAHVFGSEELSVLSPGVAQLAPRPYVGLRPEDAAHLGVEEDGLVELTVGAVVQRLAVRLRPGLAAGLAVLPLGLPGVEMVDLPAWGTVQRCGDPRS